ncbi:hypothetical protein [Endozoicomonas sp. 8E]|uniref:hypothetical protein n=1 Tax=Endozoicomonas sp. 8E TaxID=3035692 RepID=UPI0029390CAE|nr:hypothetical protein [Endozoicomonas sp. 8E]WOG28461.1 hypothetical protein P6910_02060 [Endozoicomonas sp. 8E]
MTGVNCSQTGESFATASLCVGMHTSPEKRTLQREIGMGSHAGAWEPEFCDSLFKAGRMSTLRFLMRKTVWNTHLQPQYPSFEFMKIPPSYGPC